MSSISSTPDVTTTHNFTRKQITAIFYIPAQNKKIDILTIGEGHAIEATIKHAGVAIGSDADITIRGIPADIRSQLARIPDYPTIEDLNTTTPGHTIISLQVGNYGEASTNLFSGTVDRAFTDYNDKDIPFHVHAITNTALATIPLPAQGYDGPWTVTDLLADICQQAGFQLLDHGGWDRHATLTNHYRWGSALNQIQDIAHAVKAIYNISTYTPSDESSQELAKDYDSKALKAVPYKGLLEVWGPASNGDRIAGFQQYIPVISAGNGMIGYPAYSDAGITLTTLLRPDIAFWQPIMLESRYIPDGWKTSQGNLTNKTGQTIGNAPWDGLWLPKFIRHEISSEIKGGKWHTYLDCIRTNLGKKEQTT